MKTNELKRGVRILLRNGWEAVLMDNLKGNIRMAEVYGYCTEIGSVYSHDIFRYADENGNWHDVEYTPAQLKLRKTVEKIFV